METPIELSTTQFFSILLVIGFFVGLILGLIPLFMAIKREKKPLGVTALIVSVVLGTISPVLALISCIVFVIVILRIKPKADDAQHTTLEDSVL